MRNFVLFLLLLVGESVLAQQTVDKTASGGIEIKKLWGESDYIDPPKVYVNSKNEIIRIGKENGSYVLKAFDFTGKELYTKATSFTYLERMEFNGESSFTSREGTNNRFLYLVGDNKNYMDLETFGLLNKETLNSVAYTGQGSLSHDGKFFVKEESPWNYTIYRTETYAKQATLSPKVKYRFETASFVENKYMATITDKTGIELWDFNTGRRVEQNQNPFGDINVDDTRYTKIHLTNDGKYLVVGANAYIFVFNLPSLTLKYKTSVSNRYFGASSNDKFIAVLDNGIKILDLPTGKQLLHKQYSGSIQLSPTFTPDNKFVYSMGGSSFVIWALDDKAMQEDISYESAKNGNLADCNTYLKSYPSGKYAVEIKTKKASLEKAQQAELASQKAEQAKIAQAAAAQKAKITANSNKALWKMGNKLCKQTNEGVIVASLNSWNEDKSMAQIKIVTSYGGTLDGESLAKGNTFWVSASGAGWHLCLDSEVQTSLANDNSNTTSNNSSGNNQTANSVSSETIGKYAKRGAYRIAVKLRSSQVRQYDFSVIKHVEVDEGLMIHVSVSYQAGNQYSKWESLEGIILCTKYGTNAMFLPREGEDDSVNNLLSKIGFSAFEDLKDTQGKVRKNLNNLFGITVKNAFMFIDNLSSE